MRCHMTYTTDDLKKMTQIESNLFNVIILGIAFMFIFSAFQTCEMIQEVVLESYDSKQFTGIGYKSLAVIYSFFAVANWFSAAIVLKLGSKFSLILGATTYCIFIGVFLHPTLTLLYVSSIFLGVGASILWTAQGNFLTIISEPNSISKNMGIFWSLFQTSFLIGNAIIYFKFEGITTINREIHMSLFTILLVLCIIGVCMMIAFLKNDRKFGKSELIGTANYDERAPLLSGENSEIYKQILSQKSEPKTPTNSSDSEQNVPALLPEDASYVLKSASFASFKLISDPIFLLLFFFFIFTGLQINFICSVLTTSIGYTERFGNQSKSYMGICGMVLGVGEILGGLNFGVLSSLWNKKLSTIELPTPSQELGLSRCSNIITIGYVLNTIAYFLIFLVLPSNSPINLSIQPVYVTDQLMSLVIIITASLLLGLADSAFNTQIYVTIASHYREKTSNTAFFALFKFVQSTSAAIAFFYSKYLLLHWQLSILLVTSTVGTLLFFVADYRLTNKLCSAVSLCDSAGGINWDITHSPESDNND